MGQINPEIAEIMGMCVGDGCICITDRYVEFALSGDRKEERAYYDEWVMPLLNRNLFVPILGKKLKAKDYPKTGVYGVITFDKKVVTKLLQLGLKPSPKISHGIPKPIKEGNIEIKKRFLRGYMDTDGSIAFKKFNPTSEKYAAPRIFMASVSKKLIKDSVEMFHGLGIDARFRKPWKGKRNKNLVYGFVIHRKNDVRRWINEIGFKSPKHLTKVALWKKIGECPPYTTIRQRLDILKIPHSAILKTLDLSFEL